MDLYNISIAERLRNAIGRFEECDNGGKGFKLEGKSPCACNS